MVWGSASTITAFNKFIYESALNSDPNTKMVFLRTEAFLRAIRKDLGHNDGALERFALTKMIVRGDEHHKLS